MARGGVLRGAVTAWLGLIALHAVGTTPNSGNRLAQLAGDVAGFVDRLLDPSVPGVPDLRNGERWGGGGPTPAEQGWGALVGAIHNATP